MPMGTHSAGRDDGGLEEISVTVLLRKQPWGENVFGSGGCVCGGRLALRAGVMLGGHPDQEMCRHPSLPVWCRCPGMLWLLLGGLQGAREHGRGTLLMLVHPDSCWESKATGFERKTCWQSKVLVGRSCWQQQFVLAQAKGKAPDGEEGRRGRKPCLLFGKLSFRPDLPLLIPLGMEKHAMCSTHW